MKIGIDISQIAFEKTGVANYVKNLVRVLVKDTSNEYILFASSLRQRYRFEIFRKEIDNRENVHFKIFPFPPTILDIFWNKLHIFPIELFIGSLDVFISSDWTQPPSKAKKATILYDLIVYTYPKETAEKIVKIQKRRLNWVIKEVDAILCISKATKKDAEELLHIPQSRLFVTYPGIS